MARKLGKVGLIVKCDIICVMRTIAECANDFADLRTRAKGDCVYVDKTDYFHRLVTDGGSNLFFIARPRRFGKSLMITGVSKFTKMSVFSTLSNLTDLSPKPEYAAMLGYTEEELDRYFGEHMAAHARVMGLTDADYRKVDESAEAALAQIHEKDYAAPYRVRNLPIWAIGLNSILIRAI